MPTAEDLKKILHRIDRKGYKAYRDIEGNYDFAQEGYTLFIDYVQGDPFASPSKLRVIMPQKKAGFPVECFSNKSREIATRDFIIRRFDRAIKKYSKGSRGSGKSGRIHIDRPGQEILERTAAFIDEENLEIRFNIGLPAFGRKIAGKEAIQIIFKEIPTIIDESLLFDNMPQEKLQKHYTTSEDTDFLRNALAERGLIAFVANGSVLPRISGIDPRPMDKDHAILFQSPESMEVKIKLPNAGIIKGMGLRKGINLIAGGGFHGKSTLLQSIEQGIYNHLPGDGREYVVTNPNAVKIRAEDRRNIEKVDISSFINNLPLGKSTKDFSTEDASGSTSQAANIIEAIEAGTEVLMIDEDTSATNFMIRDNRMQQLINKKQEPITPFIDKVRLLYSDYNISTILVMGGSGDYFDVADYVIGMDNYVPKDLTQKANQIKESIDSKRYDEGGDAFGYIKKRIPLARSIDPSKGKKRKKIKSGGKDAIVFGTYHIDISAVEQIADSSQTNSIGEALVYAKKYMDGNNDLSTILEYVDRDIKKYGLNVIGHPNNGDYAIFRKFELAAALNRLRSLEVKQNNDN